MVSGLGVVVLGVAMAGLAVGAEPEELRLVTARDAALTAVVNHPGLRAARRLIAEAEGRSFASGRLSNPELEVEMAGGQGSEGRVEAGVMQRFPLTSRLRLERELSKLEIEAARLEVAEQERRVAAEAGEAFINLVGLRELIALKVEEGSLARRFSESLKRRVAEGWASTLDAERSDLVVTRIELERSELKAQEIAAAGEFATRLGLAAEAIELPDRLDPAPSFPARRQAIDRTDLRLARLAAESAEVGVSLAKAERWEDVGLGVFVEGERFRDEPEGIEPEALVGMRVNIPLPLWSNGTGKVMENEARAGRRSAEVEALQLAIRNEIDAAYREMQLRYDAARSAGKILLPAARRQVESTKRAYDRGEVELESVFRASERLSEMEAIALDARKGFHLAMIRWLTAVGGLTPENEQ